MEALTNGAIKGFIVDSFTAGSYGLSFTQLGFRATKVFYYPRSYGLVLSGGLSNIASETRDFISTNQQRIIELVTQRTQRSKVL